MHSGDALLIQGEWSDIARMSREQNDWLVLGQPIEQVAKVTIDRKAPVAAGIMLLMILAMIFDWVPAVMAVIIAAVLMVFTGCLRNVEDAYRTINWESIVLIAAMMPMSLALEKTGASSGISMALVSGLGEYGPLALLAGIYFTTSLMTMFISNTATAVLLAPIAMQSAVVTDNRSILTEKPRTINKAKHIAKKKVRPNLNERKKYSTNRSAKMLTLKR